jgi:hypothetical protein
MLPARNNSSLPNVDDDASSSYPSYNTASHKQVVPSLQDQRKQPLVDRRVPSVGTFPDVSQPFDSDAWSNLAAPATISRSLHLDGYVTNTGACPDDLVIREFALRARSSDNLTFNDNHFLFSIAFCSADIIPSPTYERLQPKLNLHTIPFQVRVRHKLEDGNEARNTALLPSWPFRILQLSRLIED